MSHYYRGDNYGRGDYYQGDYYQGDFFSFARKAIGTVAHALPGVGTAYDLASTAVRGVKGLVSKGAHPNLPQPKLMITGGTAPAAYAGTGPPDIPDLGGGGPPLAIGGAAMIPTFKATGMPTMKGYHANRSTYETRGGGTSRWPKELELHPKGTVLVRNRRMNVGNARALKRALRRAGGFARLARRVMSFTHPRAGRGHFKVGKRKRK